VPAESRFADQTFFVQAQVNANVIAAQRVLILKGDIVGIQNTFVSRGSCNAQ